MAGNTWALLIGIDEYERASPLRFAMADVTAFGQFLTDVCGYSKDQVRIITNEGSTHTGIICALEAMAGLVAEEDLFIFYFAGHGVTRGGDSYLLGRNADLTSARTLQATGVGLEQVGEILDEIGARQKVLIIDACRNDPAGGRADAPNCLDNAMHNCFRDIVVRQRTGVRGHRAEASAMLLACDVGQRAWEWIEKGHSAFSHYLLTSLLEAGSETSGEIELGRVAASVQDGLEKWSAERRHQPQRAIYRCEGRARIVLGHRVGQLASSSGLASIGSGPCRAITVQGLDRHGLRGAIESASPGSQIVVQPGTYRGSLTVSKDLEIIGAGPPGSVVIESEINEGRVDGVAVRLLDYSRYTISVHHARLNIKNITIRLLGKMFQIPGYSALRAVDHAVIKAEDCDIVSTSSGAQAEAWANVAFSRCRFSDGAVGIWLHQGSHAEVFACNFKNYGSGIDVSGSSVAQIENSCFQTGLVGARVYDNSRCEIRGCDFIGYREDECSQATQSDSGAHLVQENNRILAVGV